MSTSSPRTSPQALWAELTKLRSHAAGQSSAISAVAAGKLPLSGGDIVGPRLTADVNTLSLDADTLFKLYTPGLHAGSVETGYVLRLKDDSNGEAEYVPVQVENVAALKALPAGSVPEGWVVRTLGYYTDGDGGEGVYRYWSSSSDTANDGTVIDPTNLTGRFLLLNAHEVSVRQFGAKGDGATDDLLPFRAAVAWINTIGGGTIVVPDGNFAFELVHSGAFDITKTIQLCSNLTIRMSAGTTMSVLGAWSSGVKYALFTTSTVGLYPTPSNILIDGFGATLTGINPNQSTDPGVTHAFLFLDPDSENITLRNLDVEDWGTCAKLNATNLRADSCNFVRGNNNCVAVTEATNLVFTNCRFTHCSGPGVSGSLVEGGLDVEANSGEVVTDVTVNRCVFSDNGRIGFYFQNGSGNSSKLTVIDCVFERNELYGLVCGGSAANPLTEVVVSGCRMSGNGTLGSANASQLLMGSVNGFSVSGCTIVGNTSSYGVRLTYCTNGSLASTAIKDAGGTTNTTGLYLLVCSALTVDSVTITGGSEYGILVYGGAGVNFSGCMVAQTGKESVNLRGDATNINFTGCVFAEPCLVSNGQFVVSSIEQTGHISWTGNRFVESLKYNTGIVAAYSAGPPTTLQLADLASAQDDFYNGYYILVGASRILITDYVGSTRTATLTSAYGAAPTPGTSTYRIVPNRSVNITFNVSAALNGPWYFNANDWVNSGSTEPYYATTGTLLHPTWESRQPTSIAASYTATLFDETILVDATGGARIVTLPTVANGRCMNKRFTIIKIDASVNAVTIDGSGAETINGAATQSLAAQWNKMTIQADGSAWYIVS